MNAGEVTRCFVDSNIWLYRFILNSGDRSAVQKQQIATNVTSQENLLVSTQVINEVCANLIRKAGFDKLQIQNLIEDFSEGCEILPVSLETLQYAQNENSYILSLIYKFYLSCGNDNISICHK